jgi:hypothetical protein
MSPGLKEDYATARLVLKFSDPLAQTLVPDFPELREGHFSRSVDWYRGKRLKALISKKRQEQPAPET